ncbi:MAG: signal peptidase II [Candidatus Doudnabacteria bacterium]|nr:signal peptidase II [Candidatus Doudnabacteria bacterium]
MLDQIIKFVVFRFVSVARHVVLNEEQILGIQLLKNFDFAFSLRVPEPIIFLIYIVVLAVMLIYIKNNFRTFDAKSILAWTFIVSGAISNIVERVIFGYVKDFIYIVGGGIFNFADFYILFGIALLFYIEFRREKI